MKIIPPRAPGRSDRLAGQYLDQIKALRAQGYSFEAIREGLAAEGIRVSRATLQREVARKPPRAPPAPPPPAALAEGPAPAPTRTARALPAPSSPALQSPVRGSSTRSGKDQAASFAGRRHNRPLFDQEPE